MKRILLAGLILFLGAGLFYAGHQSALRIQAEIKACNSAWQIQTQELARLRLEKQHLLECVADAKQQLAALPVASALMPLAESILADGSARNLSPEQLRLLRAELGFNWNTTGDYLIVSKRSLESIAFDGMTGSRLSPAVCAALAITSKERSVLENVTQQLGNEFSKWAKAHVLRKEPEGDVVAEYSLQIDPVFSQNLSNVFTTTLYETLGAERGDLFQLRAYSWMETLGMSRSADSPYATEPTTMIIRRYNNGSDQLNYTLKRANSYMNTSVSPWQTFPEAFQPVFPGGWRELAEREGFELPGSFNKANGQR
jgi:hypothetical protein